MEALQYFRMMEVRSEYDIEAMQKADDFPSKKEKEMWDLVAELELYRKKFLDPTMLENILEPSCDSKTGDTRVEHSTAGYVENDVDVPSNLGYCET